MDMYSLREIPRTVLMTPEEAILQMNLLGHEFFAFKNHAEGDAFAIVYRRKNGGYGLISDAD